jgi:microcin C transport system substrate-binding protein
MTTMLHRLLDQRGLLSRRDTLMLGAGAAAAIVASPLPPAAAQEETERHGISTFGDLKYPADFKHFDYVNPNAPKGGVFSQIGPTAAFNQNFLTFNSLNTFILRGDAAQGLEGIFASLMTGGADEPDSYYPLAARAVRVSADGLTYRFLLRSGLKFHDGSPITAHDVAFSQNILKEKGHPIIQQLMRDVISVEATDDATVVAKFAPGRGRDVPLFVASLPIFSRAYYSTRNFEETTLEPPLGSGPYKVGRFETGRFIEYNRVPDWWGANLPVNVGQNNFDILRYEYYRDRDVAFEGFTGKNYLFREEHTSRIWATRYDFPAIKDGRVKKDMLPDDTPSGSQGWYMNTRRAKFKDRRLREALNYAFDFEWTNRTIMYGSYERVHSPYQNSSLMAVGKPSAEELALLEPFRGQVPEEVFGDPFVPPVSDGSGSDRNMLRRAAALLQEAGYVIRAGKRVSPAGEPMTIEFLEYDSGLQPHHAPFIKNLGTLGIDATLRIVDPVQYRARADEYDFDITSMRLSMSSTPGDSLKNVFSSRAAASKGSRNLAGIADPVIDALLDKISAANTRAELTTACRAFDRVFRAGRYWVSAWHNPKHWIAYWDVFDRPPTKPRYGRGAPDTWWYDQAKAARIERAG